MFGESGSLNFTAGFEQGLWTIWGSLIAFIIGQLIDAPVFPRIRRATGERRAWLRATGSTAVSQLVTAAWCSTSPSC